MPNLHADQARPAQEVGNSLRLAKNLSMIPDATVAAAASIDDILSYLDTKEMAHAGQQPTVLRVKEAIKMGVNLGYFTAITAYTSIDDLINETPNADTSNVAIVHHE